MISYEPFFKFLETNRYSTRYLNDNNIISSETIYKMKKGGKVNLETIDHICRVFKLPIEKVVCILNEDGSPYGEDNNNAQLIQYRSSQTIETDTLKKKRKFHIENLKKIRKQAQLTRNEVAEYVGISAQTIGLWERNAQYIFEEYVVKLKEIMGISLEAIKEID